MRYRFANPKCPGHVSILLAAAWACASASALLAAPPSAARAVQHTAAAIQQGVKGFDTPQKAADALVDAAEKFDVVALTEIFGPEGNDIVFTGEFAQDRKQATDFAAEAREKKSISLDP